MIAFHARRRPSGRKLNSAERKLLAAVGSGTVVDLRAGGTGLDDPSGGAGWGRDRTIQAGMLAGLLAGDRIPHDGRPRAVRLRGARIAGSLDLQAAKLACPLILQDCYLEEPLTSAKPALRRSACLAATCQQ